MPVRKYLLAGLLVWTPLAITVAVLSWLVDSLDGAFIGTITRLHLLSPETIAWLAQVPGLPFVRPCWCSTRAKVFGPSGFRPGLPQGRWHAIWVTIG